MALGSWNHLSVFRHDWAVWLQLNSGHKEEGRSQVKRIERIVNSDPAKALSYLIAHILLLQLRWINFQFKSGLKSKSSH